MKKKVKLPKDEIYYILIRDLVLASIIIFLVAGFADFIVTYTVMLHNPNQFCHNEMNKLVRDWWCYDDLNVPHLLIIILTKIIVVIPLFFLKIYRDNPSRWMNILMGCFIIYNLGMGQAHMRGAMSWWF